MGAVNDGPRGESPGATWAWAPDLPIGPGAAPFAWPPRPLAALAWLPGRGYLLSLEACYMALAVAIWLWLAPDLASCRTLQVGWIAHLLVLNAGLMTLYAGGLHLWFHRWRRQGDRHRYAGRPLATDDPKFLWRDQVRDNMFLSLVSGATLWTAIEAGLLWAWANGVAPLLGWHDAPLWFIVLVPLLYLWESAHFFIVHRLLHSRALYRSVHAVHHKNVVLGPWAGLAMHPVEHLLYYSSAAIHLVVASHPIHMFYLFNHLVLGGITSHVGFADLQLGRRKMIDLASYYHQLHHRHFTCNYGTGVIPADLWAGSFHDGTPAATARIRKAQRPAKPVATDL